MSVKFLHEQYPRIISKEKGEEKQEEKGREKHTKPNMPQCSKHLVLFY